MVIEPAEGRLTGADTGKGRLPEPAEIFDALPSRCSPAASPRPTWPAATSWSRAGGTREYLDPVRFLGNRSSGLQGYALARAAAARGAEVTLVSANVALPDPAGVKVVRVETTAQLRDEVVAAAAVRRRRGDGRRARRLPARPRSASAKIKKAADGSAPPIELDPEPRHPPRDQHRPGRGPAR